MIYYFYINSIILLSFFSFFNKKIRFQNYVINTPFYIVLFIFILFFIFRDTSLGSDFEGYVIHYNMLLSNEVSIIAKEQEYLYRFLEHIFVILELPYWVFFSFLYLLIYYLILKSLPSNKYLMALGIFSLFIGGFFFFSLSAVRQTIAIAIFFYAIKFVIKKQFTYYLVAVIFASLFHLSAFFLIPLYFFNYLKYNSKLFIFIYLVTLVPVFQLYIYNFIYGSISAIVENIFLFKPYIRYFDSSRLVLDSSVNIGIGFIITQILNLFILLMADKVLKVKNEYNIYYILFAINCIVLNLFYNIELITRLNMYFSISFLVVFPMSLYLSKVTNLQKTIALLIVFLSILLTQGRINSMISYLEV